MKIVKLKNLNEDRLVKKFKYLKKLAVKKGYHNEFWTNYIRTILMTSKTEGFQIRVFIGYCGKPYKIYISKVNFSNKTFYINL